VEVKRFINEMTYKSIVSFFTCMIALGLI